MPEGITVYGDLKFRGECPKEDAELITFFNELRRRSPMLASVALHIKNEGKRTGAQAMAERAKGALKTGATDIVIPGRVSFICELKRLDHTKSRIELPQLHYMKNAQQAGAFTCVALGYLSALCALEHWLERCEIPVEYQRGLF